MSVKADDSKDEEGDHGSEATVVETNRFGFILGNGETDRDGPCPEIVRHRESKWLGLMTQWEQVMEKKSSKVKGQCQKGIPASVRAKGWPLLCGAKDRKEKNVKLFERLVKAPDHQGWTDIIKRDTDRQFPFHEMFQSKDGHGQKDLLEVLRAYTQYRPDEGYCQAQGPVAAVLLMNMPAEEAFWCLVQISELYLPGYYSPLLEGVLFDAAVLSSIVKKLCPAAHKHLQNQGVEPLMFATDWLMCLYSRHLPFETLLRVWDLFFCYGVRVLFQVAVVLVRRCLGEGRLRKECDGQMETLERLRGVKQRVQHEQADAFIHEVCSVSLSLTDLQKQTEKELEKWKKERPNSTFDPRGRCHGYRMVWERSQDKPKDQEKKERPKGSLTLPLTRSHSSLSPLALRKKWRKRSSKTDMEEWDGGGRKFSRNVVEESDDEEVRRRSVCGIVEEQRAKRDRLADELCSNKGLNTHPKISVVVSSSIDCDVFEKEHTETSLNQQEDRPETAQGDEKEKTACCVIEEGIHCHIQDTSQDAQSTEAQGDQDGQDMEKDKNRDDQNTEAPTNQNEQNTDTQTCEQTVETERILEPCEQSTSQEDSSKQEEELQPDSNIQEEEIRKEHCKQEQQAEDRLPNTTLNEENEENIPEKEVQIHVFPEEERSQTSSDQHEAEEESERQREDSCINTAIEQDEETQLISENHTDADKVKGIQQEFDVLPEETTEISDPSNMCEEKDGETLEDNRQDTSFDENESHSHCVKETLQTPEIVLTSFLLKTEQEIETEHPDEPTDPEQQSQSGEDVEDAEGSGNPEQSEVDSADDTNIIDPQEESAASIHSDGTCHDEENSEINPKNNDVNKPEAENIVCCEINTDESSNLTNNAEDDTCRYVHAESNEMHAAPKSENLQCNTIDIAADSGELENNSPEIAAGSNNPDSNSVTVTRDSERSEVDSADGNLENNDVHDTTESGNSECNMTDLTTETEKPESDAMDVAFGSDSSERNIDGSPDENPQYSNEQVTSGPGNTENNIVDCAVGSGNPEKKNVHVTAESGNSESNPEHVTTESDAPECMDVPSTSESGNTEDNIIDSTVGSGNSDYKEDITTSSEISETSKELVSAESGNLESKTEDSASESGNPHNNKCAIAENCQGLESTPSVSPSKTTSPNVPPAHVRVRRSSSSRVSYPTILSEDTFKEPQQQEHTHSEHTPPTPDTHAQPNSPTKSGPPKRLGLFQRLRGETNKTPVPKILIQDFSEKEERLTAKERRRRKREKERKEREEKDRKKREKEMEKDKEKQKERKKPQTRGKSFQVLSRKGDNAVTPGNSDSQTSRARRNSAPFSDGYF
ncbi:histone acetyltransferase KAT6B [Puntigrus tetrazona]|uniref:histone acetyltransferase KAT6B n=1 Tax=Puntigrus tetrazona TaxID=1606681 RepID=UPI001C89D2AA|nr:histone acetyltransferase KAT6B [Puntigrus tetrazona]XP_043113331.1 histone acetyltransferase KAT6B [Puntigrus tetrazona]